MATFRKDTRGASGDPVMGKDPVTVTEPGKDRPLAYNYSL